MKLESGDYRGKVDSGLAVSAVGREFSAIRYRALAVQKRIIAKPPFPTLCSGRLPPVAQRLGDVNAADLFAVCKIGDRARHAQDTRVCYKQYLGFGNVGFRPIADIGLFSDAVEMREFAAIALLLSLGACGEQTEENYSTWSEAQSAGAIERGWIPSFVPETAQDIRDSHNLDTNAQRLQFTVPPSDVSAMISGLRRISADDNSAAAELSRELGFGGASDTYVVCSGIRSGALVVDAEAGQAAYDTTVRWADDDCSQAA